MGIFSKPKAPAVTQAPIITPEAVPERTAEQTSEIADSQRRRFATSGGGRAATMLTGGTGTSGGSQAVRFLGGAART